MWNIGPSLLPTEWFCGAYTTFLKVIFDFDFDSLVYRKTLSKTSEQKELRTSPTNFEHLLRWTDTHIKSVELAVDPNISSWHSLCRLVLDSKFYSALNGPRPKGVALEKYGSLSRNPKLFDSVLLVCQGKTSSSTYHRFTLVSFVRYRIEFYKQQNQLA